MNSLAAYRAAAKQAPLFQKTAIGFSSFWGSYWGLGTTPPAGTLATGNTTTGVVPTNATTGAAAIASFSGNSGYLTGAEVTGNNAGRIMLFDRLFAVGALAFNAGTTTLGSQPSYSSRIPGGTDYTGLQIWFETVTSMGGAGATVTVTYTNQAGTAAQSTGATAIANGGGFTTPGMFQFPLASGDTGVQKIESITQAGGTSGTYNILVLRPLLHVIVKQLNAPTLILPWLTKTPQIWSDSCLMLACIGTASPIAPDVRLEIASG